jgi:hypothetical protein
MKIRDYKPLFSALHILVYLALEFSRLGYFNLLKLVVYAYVNTSDQRW